MAYDEMELDLLGDRRTALFVIISDTDDTFNFVVSIMYTQLFNLLCDRADDQCGDAAARYFKENGISKLPGYKALQAEIESLIQEKNSGYNDYRAKREEYRRLQTVKGNIDQILHRERKPVKRQEQER